MATIRNPDLFSAWLAADRLPADYVRALIEELDWQLQRQSYGKTDREPRQTPSSPLEHPLLRLRR